MNTLLVKFSKNTESYQTHLSLTGGKYNVPDDMFDSFYDTYFNELNNKTKMYLVEKIKDSHFAFFMDIDGADTSSDDIKLILNVIINTIKTSVENFTDDMIQTIISRCENKYHINFYNLIVNNDLALELVKNAKNILVKQNEKYDKIIDSSVYKTGLRLLGSFKKGGSTCYKLYDLMNDCDIDLDKENFLKCIIRRKKNILLTKFKNEFINSIKVKSNAKTNINVTKITNHILQEELYKLLQFIKKTNVQELDKYALNRHSVSSIHASPNTQGVFCYYISIVDKHCPFKCREHIRTTSPIYIEINIKGIFIKCYDKECLKMTYPENGIKLPENLCNDYPELYNSMTDKYWNVNLNITPQIRKYLEESLTGTHYKICQAIFNIYKDKFRVDDIKHPEWYIYNDVRWEKTYRLNIMVSEELPRYYKGMKIKNDKNTYFGLEC